MYQSIQFSSNMQHLTLDPHTVHPPTRDLPATKRLPTELPPAKQVKLHPHRAGGENAFLYFVGTATVVLLVLFPPLIFLEIFF